MTGEKKTMNVTKEEAVKTNKELAKTRRPIKNILLEEKQKKKTIAEKDNEFVEQVQKKMADPNLLIDSVKEIQKKVAGEEDTIISEIIVTTTRLVKDDIPESKNLFLSDITGIGKDHVTKKT